MDLFSFLRPLGAIILIDLTLSGDNAVVIGMAAHRLPEHQRRTAIVIGASFAIVLRVALTAAAAWLLTVPFLKLGGGLLLAWVAFKLLKEEEEAYEGSGGSETLREAVQTIVIADFVMSLDNVVSVAAAADGSTSLLIFGLALSMAIMMFAGSLVAKTLDRFWWLAYAGSGVIAWIAGEMILTDPYAGRHLEKLGIALAHAQANAGAHAFALTPIGWAIVAVFAALVVSGAHRFHRRGEHRS
jgi:YjbE family integral membrane protein